MFCCKKEQIISIEDTGTLPKLEITIDDYLNLSHIHISNRKTGLGHVDMALYRLGLKRDITLRAQHFLVAPYILEKSELAITTIKSFTKGKDFKILQLPFEVKPLVLHLLLLA